MRVVQLGWQYAVRDDRGRLVGVYDERADAERAAAS